MSRRFATDIDLLKFSLLNAMLNPVSSDPTGLGAGDAGRVWFRTDTTPPSLRFWNGTAAIDVKDLGSATGTTTSSKISDLATTVQAYSLSLFAAPTADLSVASHKLINVTDPTGNQDAATKNYVDQSISGATGGLVLKGAVAVAATTNVSITSAPSTIDGVTMVAGMVVLLTAQTTATERGPYVWTSAGAAMARATNWDTSAKAALGSFWVVEQGSNADLLAMCTNDTAITLGTTTPTFIFRGSGATYTQGNGINITGTVVSAVPTTGVLVGGSGIGADFSIVTRKNGGVVPTSTGGIFTVSGTALTVNHGLSSSCPVVVVRAYTSPSPYVQGQLLECDNTATDANNVSITLPSTPGSNQYIVEIYG
jgi:hypothetical protein